jgi:cyclophilin family peptidyl-prolyl cis-trans isomerase
MIIVRAVESNAAHDRQENTAMANKKKIEEREKALRAKRAERNIRFAGIGVILLLLIAGVAYFFPKAEQTPASDAFGDQTACERFADIPVATQYDEPPLNIDTSKQYFATVGMAKGGDFVIQLFPDKAPKTVNSFIFLSCKGYFEGVTFHRVLDNFIAQGGDPTGTGRGGPGYQFENEDNDLAFDKPGVVAMANAGRDTNGSQFFITFVPRQELTGGYTIFGQVIEGMDVVNGLTRRNPETNPTFQGDAIQSITVTES